MHMSFEWLDLLQWPAMAVTVMASWLVGSASEARRKWGFYVFVCSNVLWTLWGWTTGAWALIVLQLALFVLNLRGVRKTKE